MVWHDCKTDPPKKSGLYLVFFYTFFGRGIEVLRYIKKDEAWFEKTGNNYKKLVRKWTEIDLSEVE